MIEQKFFAIPPPCEVESPISWLARAASSQGESLWSFVRLLGFTGRRDLDRQFTDAAPRHIAQVCGLSASSFDSSHRILSHALELRLENPVLLVYMKRPRYRYCPLCLKSQSVPYFPVHWRFDVWRMCYTHMCLMEDRCPHCDRYIVPQRDMMFAGPKRAGVAFLSQCMHCGKLLWKARPFSIHSRDLLSLHDYDRMQIANGNAFVSALAQGYADIPNVADRTIKRCLPLAEKMRLLPSPEDGLTAEKIRKNCLFNASLGAERSEGVHSNHKVSVSTAERRLKNLFGLS
ncbi:TniQ family protein [Polaromonas sp. YR568]|uniref:TniQ family protein n=1 Tax=Polaromonas sp. YR568 TaxID=1855301 RepID=UPI00398C116E